MLTRLHYVFEPTSALLHLTAGTEDRWLCEPGIYSVDEPSRGPAQYSRDEVEGAFWALFLQRLESSDEADMRKRCESLGFEACWRVIVAGYSDPADALIKQVATGALSRPNE